MPVYLLTIHAYGSWREDHPKGYVQRGQGLQPTNEALRMSRDRAMRQPAVIWDHDLQRLVAPWLEKASKQYSFDLHAVATTPTHAHVLLAFASPEHTFSKGAARCPPSCPAMQQARKLAARLKKDLGYGMARHCNTRGMKWLSRGWNLTAVKDRKHFDHLATVYLPKHRQQSGTFWRRDMREES